MRKQQYGLGRFGDRRLEKGGPSFMPRLLLGLGRACGGWEGRGQVR